MTSGSLPIGGDDVGQDGSKFIALGVCQIDFIAFGKDIEQKDRHIRAAIERDHSQSSTLAPAPASKSDLTCSTSARDHIASLRVCGNGLHDGESLLLAESSGLRVTENGRAVYWSMP